MKHLTMFVLIGIMVVAFASSSLAYPKPVAKLKKGVLAVATSPLEVKDHTMAETKDAKFLPLALAGGMLKGVFYMAKKAGAGALDVVTFPIDR